MEIIIQSEVSNNERIGWVIRMGALQIIFSNTIFIFAIAVASVGVFHLYNRLPAVWFWEYGYDRDDPDFFASQPSSRMKIHPDRIWFCSGFVFVSFAFFLRCGWSLALFCSLFTVFFFSYILIADIKTRIIPDQFIVGLLFVSLLWMVEGLSYLQISNDPWYMDVSLHVAGGVAGGGILWIIGTLGSHFLKQEAMGMGDVKLAFACGMIVSLEGILWVVILAFLFAAFPSVLHLLKKQVIIKNMDRSSDSAHKPQNQLPFAPFIVVAATLYLLFPGEFAFLTAWYTHLSFV